MPHAYLSYSGQTSAADPSAMLNATLTREVYTADSRFEGDPRTMQCQHLKATAGAVRLFRIRHRQMRRCVVRRSWENIRTDGRACFIVWFPVVGRITIEQDRQVSIVDASSFGISYSNRPFQIEIASDHQEQQESYQIVIPPHVINTRLPHLDKLAGRVFALDAPEALQAKKTFIDLFQGSERMNEKVALAFVDASLEALAAVLHEECDRRREETDVKRLRLRAILAHIDFHLCDPGLSAVRVAAECRISTRYLHSLLKLHGTTFHDYIWCKRLERTHEWLCNDNGQSVSHVAAMGGFRTISHFSRLFKATYGYSPSDARTYAGKPTVVEAGAEERRVLQ